MWVGVGRLQEGINKISANLGAATAEADLVVMALRKATEAQQQLEELERLKVPAFVSAFVERCSLSKTGIRFWGREVVSRGVCVCVCVQCVC